MAGEPTYVLGSPTYTRLGGRYTSELSDSGAGPAGRTYRNCPRAIPRASKPSRLKISMLGLLPGRTSAVTSGIRSMEVRRAIISSPPRSRPSPARVTPSQAAAAIGHITAQRVDVRPFGYAKAAIHADAADAHKPAVFLLKDKDALRHCFAPVEPFDGRVHFLGRPFSFGVAGREG